MSMVIFEIKERHFGIKAEKPKDARYPSDTSD
jgi:hypothetical protein